VDFISLFIFMLAVFVIREAASASHYKSGFVQRISVIKHA
jgi:hypothetical protein